MDIVVSPEIAESFEASLSGVEAAQGAEKARKLAEFRVQVCQYPPSSLSDGIVGRICQLHKDDDKMVRAGVLQYIEDVWKKFHFCEEKEMHMTLALLALVDSEEAPVVLKLLLTCLGLVLKVTTEKICVGANIQPIELNTYKTIEAALKNMLGRFGSVKHHGVLLHELKLLEVLALMYSPTKPKDPPGAPQLPDLGFCLEKIPKNHQKISYEDAEVDGQKYLKMLMQPLTERMPASIVMVAITSLGIVGRMRPPTLPDIVKALLKFQEDPPEGYTEPQLRSIFNTLKFVTVLLIRNGWPSVPYWETLRKILVNLGEKVQADRACHDAERGLPSNMLGSLKEVSESSYGDTKLSELPPELFDYLKIIPARTLAEVFISHLENLPGDLPPGPQDSMTYYEDVGQMFARVVQDIRAGKFVSPPLPQAQALVRDARAVRRDPRLGPQAPVPLTENEFKVSVDSVKKFRESVLEKVAEYEALVKSETKRGPATITIPLLTNEECENMQKAAVLRMIAAEPLVAMEGRSGLRHRLLARHALAFPLESDVCQALLNHILEDFAGRRELAITWLFAEFVRDGDPSGGAPVAKLEVPTQRYNALLLSMLKALRASLGPTDQQQNELLGQLLLDVPEVTEEAILFVKDICLDMVHVRVGLVAIRELILRKPAYKEDALRIVLDLSVDSNEHIRESTIRLIANQLYEQYHLTAQIEEFAKSTLARVKELSGDNHEEDVKKHMELYLGLCLKNNGLLKNLVTVYVESPVSVRKIIHRQTQVLISTIGMKSEELLDVIQHSPKEGNALILHILHTLTDNDVPSLDLIAAARSVYSSTDDIRFLIPVIGGIEKKEVLAKLHVFVSQLKAGVGSPLRGAFQRMLRLRDLMPHDLLVALHKEALNKKTVAAVDDLLAMGVLDKDAISRALNILVSESKVPDLFMRTLIGAVNMYPDLLGFALSSLLPQLIQKRVLDQKSIWEGFKVFTKKYLSKACTLVIQLPREKLEEYIQDDAVKAELKARVLETTDKLSRDVRAVLEVKDEEIPRRRKRKAEGDRGGDRKR